MTTQGFVADTDPNFCEIANQRMCTNFWEKESCCCVNEVQAYRKCVFDKIIVPSLPRLQAGAEECTDTCDYNFLVQTEEEPTGEGVIIGAALGGAVVFIACIVIYCFCLRRKNANSDNQGGPANDIEKGGSNTDDEDGILDNSMCGDDDEEPMLEGKSPEAIERSVRSIDDSIREYTKKMERLKKKKEKIHEWRELQKQGSDEKLTDYISDEELETETK